MMKSTQQYNSSQGASNDNSSNYAKTKSLMSNKGPKSNTRLSDAQAGGGLPGAGEVEIGGVPKNDRRWSYAFSHFSYLSKFDSEA